MSSSTTLQYNIHSIEDSQSILNTPAKIIPEKWGGRNPSFYNYDQSFIDDLSTKFKVFTGSPEEVKIFNDVIYIPEYYCLYSSDGLRIDYSCLYKGPKRSKLSISAKKKSAKTKDKIEPPNKITPPKQLKKISQKFIYVSRIRSHYGHFLTESIARLWYVVKEREYSVLYHGQELQKTLIDLFFESVKLDKNLFSSFKEPVLLKEVIIPYPSFSIQCEGFEVHKLLPESVAKNLLPKKLKTTSQPLYFSRRYLDPKKRLIINESLLEEKLSKSGFAIVYPEKLSLQEQIELINKHELIVGTLGSALHSILFDISSQRNLVSFGTQEELNTNYLIIDAIKSVNSIYISALQKDPNCFKTTSNRNRILDLDIAISGLQKFGLI
ncbi:MAG: glycosyltransferase 61 family protein [Xenococcaceae cyanobacterium MO_167.B27]|nr:glycosyltransferase 61 family protein [Xenococcaceae cyanobacterium MO_167.B27]